MSLTPEAHIVELLKLDPPTFETKYALQNLILTLHLRSLPTTPTPTKIMGIKTCPFDSLLKQAFGQI